MIKTMHLPCNNIDQANDLQQFAAASAYQLGLAVEIRCRVDKEGTVKLEIDMDIDDGDQAFFNAMQQAFYALFREQAAAQARSTATMQ